jgi:hypothetical protein
MPALVDFIAKRFRSSDECARLIQIRRRDATLIQKYVHGDFLNTIVQNLKQTGA